MVPACSDAVSAVRVAASTPVVSTSACTLTVTAAMALSVSWAADCQLTQRCVARVSASLALAAMVDSTLRSPACRSATVPMASACVARSSSMRAPSTAIWVSFSFCPSARWPRPAPLNSR